MRANVNRTRRPFWLPASNYYVFAVGISTAVFFLVWGILHDDGDETPWVTAGIASSMLICCAVVLREVILRRNRGRFFIDQRRTPVPIYDSMPGFGDPRSPQKLTLEINATILSEIQRKSDAANTLRKISAGHHEVFELCSEYIARIETELRTVNPGSPRLAPLLRGRTTVSEFHKYHLLKWAEIEARSLTQEARNGITKADRMRSAEKALRVIESALESYPNEAALVQSEDLLREMVVSIKVSHWVEKAEKAVQRGNFELGKSLYRDALHYLGRDNVQNQDRDQAAQQINAEIERIIMLESGNQH